MVPNITEQTVCVINNPYVNAYLGCVHVQVDEAGTKYFASLQQGMQNSAQALVQSARCVQNCISLRSLPEIKTLFCDLQTDDVLSVYTMLRANLRFLAPGSDSEDLATFCGRANDEQSVFKKLRFGRA